MARNEQKAASALSLGMAGKVVTLVDCRIEDLLEVIKDLIADAHLSDPSTAYQQFVLRQLS